MSALTRVQDNLRLPMTARMEHAEWDRQGILRSVAEGRITARRGVELMADLTAHVIGLARREQGGSVHPALPMLT